MRFSLAFFASVLATAVAQTALGPNAFNIPPSGNYLLSAGNATTFTWSNLQGSTVTLQLRSGSNGDLNAGTTIISGLANTGSYTWNVPADTVEGNSYTIEIIDDQDPSQVNYTPQFDILSPVKATPTASGSASASASGSTSVTGAPSSTSGVISVTGSSNSTTATGSSTTQTGSVTTSTKSSTTSPSSTGSAATVPTGNAAANLKIGGGMLALVAGVAVML